MMVPALPAATVLLLRDGAAGIEVFLVKRHHQVDFVAGAFVFPGGKVDVADRDPALIARCRSPVGLDEAARALRIAAIREVFEESGLLLACPAEDPTRFVAAERLGAIAARWRPPPGRVSADLKGLIEAEDLVLATDALVPFAHWITPAPMPKRFDTFFFAARAPEDQLAAHDGGELVDSLWSSPADALAEYEAGRAQIVFPTRLNLLRLTANACVEDALAAARDRADFPVLPEVGEGPDGLVLRIPEAAGYGVTTVPLKNEM